MQVITIVLSNLLQGNTSSLWTLTLVFPHGELDHTYFLHPASSVFLELGAETLAIWVG